MKKLFLTVILASISFLCSAQTLCGLEIEKGEKVNYYYLDFEEDIFTLKAYKSSYQWPVPNEVNLEDYFQIISKRLNKEKFTFNPQNDTILITDTFRILRIYTKSKQYKYSHSNVDFRLRKLERKLSENMLKGDDAIYHADFITVKELLKKQGYIFTYIPSGSGFALRIIIKDGRIQYPIDFWRYYPLY